MFTGLIEETGTINEIQLSQNGAEIKISAKKVFDDLKIGDSISVNGVCQTVTKIQNNIFTIFASKETLSLTTFNNLSKNDEVNLERAMKADSRFGGHIVSGHVEDTGITESIIKEGNSIRFSFSASKDILKYIVHKGSVTINGVSLTVCKVDNNNFDVTVIPHTFENTTFKNLKKGDKVNIETDILAKYVESFMIKKNNVDNIITEDFLKEHGF